MNPLFSFIWLNQSMAFTLRRPRRRPILRVIEGGREPGAPRLLKLNRMPGERGTDFRHTRPTGKPDKPPTITAYSSRISCERF